ncbi:ureidoglycolate lyase [Rhizobiales bacterium TNE-4]|nr:ureidoglycolate lyase [Rhizobiales bacterium TNE-4]MBV1828986.1 ureidoglycolate lyase [Rhizobiales bacterium TNE-4]
MNPKFLSIGPLTQAAFSPFGEVIEQPAQGSTINQGFADRFDRLAHIETKGPTGLVNISLFTARKRPSPIVIKMMERHPLGSQLFYPLQDRDWIVVVCTDPRDQQTYRAFRATGRQGVNYARNTWHHPLIVLADDERFFVVDRGDTAANPAKNLEELWLDERDFLQLTLEG